MTKAPMKQTKINAKKRKIYQDGFSNIIAGLGNANIKQMADTYDKYHDNPIEAEKAYHSSTWFGKIVDIPAFDATRQGRTWKADKDVVIKIEQLEKRLNLLSVLRRALIFSRLYGGAIIVPGGLPGANHEPLNLHDVSKGNLKSLTVLSRHEISYEEIDRDPFSPLCGKPKMWLLPHYNKAGHEVGQMRLHPSRVVMVTGRKSAHSFGADLWGGGIWAHMRDAVTASDAGASILASLMKEAKIDIYGLPDMMSQMQTEEYEQALLSRFMMTNMMKSINNIVVKDAADTWEQKQIDFAGLPDVMNTLLTIMAGAADIPVTRLIGTSASGLSATGEHDMKNYYDSVKAMQETELTPAISLLDELIIRSSIGGTSLSDNITANVDHIWYEWDSLWQPTEKEQAETAKIKAEVTAIYVNAELFDKTVIAKAAEAQLLEDGVYPAFFTQKNNIHEKI